MDTKQPEALVLATELRAGKWMQNILQNESALRDRAANEIERQHARIAELECRLEVDARHPYDGIACRDATIAELQAGYDAARLEIAELESQLEAARHALDGLQRYDQQALEPCTKCYWKTLVPGDCCVNCRRNELEAQLAAVGAAPAPCKWRTDECDVWESECGRSWQFTDGGPADNNVRFCHGCGRPVEVAQ